MSRSTRHRRPPRRAGRSRGLWVAAAAAASLAGTTVVAHAVDSGDGSDTGRLVTIVSACAGKGSTLAAPTGRSRPTVSAADGSTAQTWRVSADASGLVRVASAVDGRVLDVERGRTSAGTAVILWQWHGGLNQQWKLADQPDGTAVLEAAHAPGQVLTLARSTGRVRVGPAGRGCATRWRVTPVDAVPAPGGSTTPEPSVTATPTVSTAPTPSTPPTSSPTTDPTTVEPSSPPSTTAPGGGSGSDAVTYSVPAGTGKGRTYYVSTSGSDSASGSKDAPFRTIDHATSKAGLKPGDVVDVQAGTYTEQVSLEADGSAAAAITLKGEPGAIIRHPNQQPDECDAWMDAVIGAKGRSYWLIEGFEVRDARWAGIMAAGSHHVVIANNVVKNSGGPALIGMPLDNFNGGEGEVQSSDITIVGNTVDGSNIKFVHGPSCGSQETIDAWGVDGFRIAGNTILKSDKEGIDCKTGCRNGRIDHNTITHTASIEGTASSFRGGAGIYVDGDRSKVFKIRIDHNVLHHNTAVAIALAVEGADSDTRGDLSQVQVDDNVTYSNGIQGVNAGAGISIASDISDVVVEHNTSYKDVQGIVVTNGYGGYRSKGVVIRNNVMASESYRGAAVGSAAEVTLTDNVFAPAGSGGFEREADAVANLTETGTQHADVQFVNAPDDLHVQGSSPGAGQGVRGPVGAPGTPASPA